MCEINQKHIAHCFIFTFAAFAVISRDDFLVRDLMAVWIRCAITDSSCLLIIISFLETDQSRLESGLIFRDSHC